MENLQPVYKTNKKQTDPEMFCWSIDKQPVSRKISRARREPGAMHQNKDISEDLKVVPPIPAALEPLREE